VRRLGFSVGHPENIKSFLLALLPLFYFLFLSVIGLFIFSLAGDSGSLKMIIGVDRTPFFSSGGVRLSLFSYSFCFFGLDDLFSPPGPHVLLFFPSPKIGFFLPAFGFPKVISVSSPLFWPPSFFAFLFLVVYLKPCNRPKLSSAMEFLGEKNLSLFFVPVGPLQVFPFFFSPVFPTLSWFCVSLPNFSLSVFSFMRGVKILT